MAGYDNAEPITAQFQEQAGTVVLEVDDMKIKEDQLTFRLRNASSYAADVEAAGKVVVTGNKEQFLKDPSSCAHVTIGSIEDLSNEGYNPFTGTATIGVKNLAPEELKQIVGFGCAVAEIQESLPQTQLASADISPQPR